MLGVTNKIQFEMRHPVLALKLLKKPLIYFLFLFLEKKEYTREVAHQISVLLSWKEKLYYSTHNLHITGNSLDRVDQFQRSKMHPEYH